MKKKAEEFRRQQQEILRQAESRINKEFDRAQKMHSIEFDVIPTAWSMLNNIFSLVWTNLFCITSIPNFKLMSNPQIIDFFEKNKENDLSKFDLDQILNSHNKEADYLELIKIKRLNKLISDFIEFRDYIYKNKIFMPLEISTKFDEILILINHAITEYEMNLRKVNNPNKIEKISAFDKDGRNAKNDLENLIKSFFLKI